MDERKLYTEKQMQDAVTLAAVKAANETAAKLAASFGISVANLEQTDRLREELRYLREIHEDRKERQKDIEWARSVRRGSTWAGTKIAMLIVIAAATGMVGALFEGSRVMFLRWIGH